ncbi:hypothetical protein GDO81_006074 [Engystomops pustulosus]|uniref:Beta/gamma crystallin 'Greek key' domain-containing protein n=2 Tax=Engystomops pustulosus TaxID=76066 RepID=A0AAV7CXJ3_ENGPU|nr:hypothetical protein GDO81_006074 [Engystomops pustulosus]
MRHQKSEDSILRRASRDSKSRSLSYSELELPPNSLLQRFGSLTWRKKRFSVLEYSDSPSNVSTPAESQWSVGRMERPAVGSELDLKSRLRKSCVEYPSPQLTPRKTPQVSTSFVTDDDEGHNGSSPVTTKVKNVQLPFAFPERLEGEEEEESLPCWAESILKDYIKQEHHSPSSLLSPQSRGSHTLQVMEKREEPSQYRSPLYHRLLSKDTEEDSFMEESQANTGVFSVEEVPQVKNHLKSSIYNKNQNNQLEVQQTTSGKDNTREETERITKHISLHTRILSQNRPEQKCGNLSQNEASDFPNLSRLTMEYSPEKKPGNLTVLLPTNNLEDGLQKKSEVLQKLLTLQDLQRQKIEHKPEQSMSDSSIVPIARKTEEECEIQASPNTARIKYEVIITMTKEEKEQVLLPALAHGLVKAEKLVEQDPRMSPSEESPACGFHGAGLSEVTAQKISETSEQTEKKTTQQKDIPVKKRVGGTPKRTQVDRSSVDGGLLFIISGSDQVAESSKLNSTKMEKAYNKQSYFELSRSSKGDTDSMKTSHEQVSPQLYVGHVKGLQKVFENLNTKDDAIQHISIPISQQYGSLRQKKDKVPQEIPVTPGAHGPVYSKVYNPLRKDHLENRSEGVAVTIIDDSELSNISAVSSVSQGIMESNRNHLGTKGSTKKYIANLELTDKYHADKEANFRKARNQLSDLPPRTKTPPPYKINNNVSTSLSSPRGWKNESTIISSPTTSVAERLERLKNKSSSLQSERSSSLSFSGSNFSHSKLGLETQQDEQNLTKLKHTTKSHLSQESSKAELKPLSQSNIFNDVSHIVDEKQTLHDRASERSTNINHDNQDYSMAHKESELEEVQKGYNDKHFAEKILIEDTGYQGRTLPAEQNKVHMRETMNTSMLDSKWLQNISPVVTQRRKPPDVLRDAQINYKLKKHIRNKAADLNDKNSHLASYLMDINYMTATKSDENRDDKIGNIHINKDIQHKFHPTTIICRSENQVNDNSIYLTKTTTSDEALVSEQPLQEETKPEELKNNPFHYEYKQGNSTPNSKTLCQDQLTMKVNQGNYITDQSTEVHVSSGKGEHTEDLVTDAMDPSAETDVSGIVLDKTTSVLLSEEAKQDKPEDFLHYENKQRNIKPNNNTLCQYQLTMKEDRANSIMDQSAGVHVVLEKGEHTKDLVTDVMDPAAETDVSGIVLDKIASVPLSEDAKESYIEQPEMDILKDNSRFLLNKYVDKNETRKAEEATSISYFDSNDNISIDNSNDKISIDKGLSNQQKHGMVSVTTVDGHEDDWNNTDKCCRGLKDEDTLEQPKNEVAEQRDQPVTNVSTTRTWVEDGSKDEPITESSNLQSTDQVGSISYTDSNVKAVHRHIIDHGQNVAFRVEMGSEKMQNISEIIQNSAVVKKTVNVKQEKTYGMDMDTVDVKDQSMTDSALAMDEPFANATHIIAADMTVNTEVQHPKLSIKTIDLAAQEIILPDDSCVRIAEQPCNNLKKDPDNMLDIDVNSNHLSDTHVQYQNSAQTGDATMGHDMQNIDLISKHKENGEELALGMNKQPMEVNNPIQETIVVSAGTVNVLDKDEIRKQPSNEPGDQIGKLVFDSDEKSVDIFTRKEGSSVENGYGPVDQTVDLGDISSTGEVLNLVSSNKSSDNLGEHLLDTAEQTGEISFTRDVSPTGSDNEPVNKITDLPFGKIEPTEDISSAREEKTGSKINEYADKLGAEDIDKDEQNRNMTLAEGVFTVENVNNKIGELVLDIAKTGEISSGTEFSTVCKAESVERIVQQALDNPELNGDISSASIVCKGNESVNKTAEPIIDTAEKTGNISSTTKSFTLDSGNEIVDKTNELVLDKVEQSRDICSAREANNGSSAVVHKVNDLIDEDGQGPLSFSYDPQNLQDKLLFHTDVQLKQIEKLPIMQIGSLKDGTKNGVNDKEEAILHTHVNESKLLSDKSDEIWQEEKLKIPNDTIVLSNIGDPTVAQPSEQTHMRKGKASEVEDEVSQFIILPDNLYLKEAQAEIVNDESASVTGHSDMQATSQQVKADEFQEKTNIITQNVIKDISVISLSNTEMKNNATDNEMMSGPNAISTQIKQNSIEPTSETIHHSNIFNSVMYKNDAVMADPSLNYGKDDEIESSENMEILVNKLRQMETPETLKSLKAPRQPRCSALSMYATLPPIKEDQGSPKSERFDFKLPSLEIKEKKILQEESESTIQPKVEEKSENPEESEKKYSWERNTEKSTVRSSPLELMRKHSGDDVSRSDSYKAFITQNFSQRSGSIIGSLLLSDKLDKKTDSSEGKSYSRLESSFLLSSYLKPQNGKAEVIEETETISENAASENDTVSTTTNDTNTATSSTDDPQQEDLVDASTPVVNNVEDIETPELPSKVNTSVSSSFRVFPDVWHHPEKSRGKLNPRPGKIILFSEPGFMGHCYKIYSDVGNTCEWQLQGTISVQIIRGGWLLYEKPYFRGRRVMLSEGDTDLTCPWDCEGKSTENLQGNTKKSKSWIGSLRHVVKDFQVPRISLFMEENGDGNKIPIVGATPDSSVNGQPIKTESIIVHSGLWLVYSKPFFEGDPYILEPGGYPNRKAWNGHDSHLCSLQPARIGGPIVEKSNEPKILLFKYPGFEGQSWEVTRDLHSLQREPNQQGECVTSVGSMKVLGGCWVLYEKEGFHGHQYLLEEGEYQKSSQWGGYTNELGSLRHIRTDFSEPEIILYQSGGLEGSCLRLNEALADIEIAEYGTNTGSIQVLNGVWVAYENVDFSGEQYILEKGIYQSYHDWGAKDSKICSVQPVLQVGGQSLQYLPKIQLFSEPNFHGDYMMHTEDRVLLSKTFSPQSCRVEGGSWILYEGENYSGEQYILVTGDYPTRTAMGCQSINVIRSLKKIPLYFSIPSISLHGLERFEGKELKFTSAVRSLQGEGYNNHVLSIKVGSGIWLLYEHSNFRGRQWLLERTQIANWLTFSGIQRIGSLCPIEQRRVYFRLRNRALGLYLCVPEPAENMKAARVQVTKPREGSCDLWYYEEGCLKNQMTPQMSLQVVGMTAPGTKVVMWSEGRKPIQTWSIEDSGLIMSRLFEDLCLDIKGGHSFDSDHVVVWEPAKDRLTQHWDLEVF